MLPEEIINQLRAAADAASLAQGKAFPGFTETTVIIFHASERPSEWSGRAFRAQAKIDPKKRPVRMRAIESVENFSGQPVEEFVIRKMRRELAFFAVQKNKIDIRTVIQF